VSDSPITIAVDAMGGDNAPGEIVLGAIQAAQEQGIGVWLVGPEETLRAETNPFAGHPLAFIVVIADAEMFFKVFPRVCHADPREQERSDDARQQTDPRFRKSKLRGVDGNGDIAGCNES